MNWIHLNLWLVVLALLMPYYVKAEESERSSFHDEDEMLPSEQTADAYDVPMAQNMATAQSGRRFSRQSYAPNYNNRNVGGNAGLQFARLLPAPLISQPLDAQASSNSKQVAFADNKRNKLSDFTKPAEETLKRLTRNPDVMDQLVGQFQQMGGGMTQNVLQEVTQAAPNISESLGKAFNEAFTQTNMLAQVAPGNLDISKLTPSLSQSNLPGSLDFGQLGQAISQNFLVGTTQNLFGALTGQAAPQPVVGAASAAATDSDTVGAAAPDAETEGTPQQDADVASPAPKNPFEQLVGQSLMPGLPGISGLPGLPSLGPMSPLGPLNPLSMIGQIAPLMGMGSEISEVRVLPDNYSPYKVSPKEVDHQTISEMKLKAVLKDALSKKTIPILWFHLPNKNIEQKSPEQFEMEAKLDHFEQQVIAELKQLQELAKMANEVKRVQLQSGFQPTTSLNTKLDLHEIPIYDITLGDIERTLKDEHVIMLMQTLVQKKKDFQRHQQATTKYITDLTGTPIKRHIIPNEETLKGMEKDDMLKMMTYAYRMAALNGHDMPWIKKKISSLDEKDASKPSMTSQQSSAMARNMQMGGERQWLAEKEQQMAMEADRQRQMQKTMAQSQMMMTPQMQMQQPQAFQRQMMPIENQMSAMDMTMQQQQQPQMQQNNERQMMPQSMMMMDNFQMAQQMPMQRQQQQQQHMMQMNWAEPNLQQTQRTMAEPSTVDSINPPEQKVAQVTEIKTKTADMNTQKMLYSELTKPQSMTDGRQQTVAEKEDKTATTPSTMSETKPQMSEDEGKARFKGIDDMFGGSDLFGTKKKHPSIPPTIINYYYNAGGSRYPPSRPSPSYSYQGSYGGGYTNYPPPPPHHYQRPASNQYTYGSYRAATGDEEIAEMLEEHKQEQSKPKLMLMMVMPDNEKSNTSAPETTNQETPTEDKNKNPQKSNQTSSSILHNTTTPPQPLSAPTSSSLSSSSQLPSSSPESSNDSGPEVGSLFAYEPQILEPFMGLHSIDRPNDPWHHKAFDLHRPLYSGGGSYERYLQKGRYKRDLATSASAQSPRFAKNRNTLTPEMLGRILHIKSNFKKYYPGLYNTMMGQLTNGKSTKISITPPKVPEQVSHKNLELAAAEINPLESLIHTYEEDLKRITEMQKEQQENGFQDSLINSYKNEFNFWSNPREEILPDTPITEENFLPPQPETITTAPIYEESSFWEDPQNLLKQFEEEQNIIAGGNKLPLSVPTTYTANSEDDLKPLTESQLVFQNPPEERIENEPAAVAKSEFQENLNDGSLNFWENPQEALKDLTQEPVLFHKPDDNLNEDQNLWKSPDETSNDTYNDDALNPNPEMRTFENDENNVWEEPSALQKRSSSKSFWTELEAEEEQKENKKDDSKPIFDFDEDFD